MPTSRATDKAPLRRAQLTTGVALPPPLNELAARFGSFANTVQTRLDTSSAGSASLGGNLQAQVERALAQVLRQPNAAGGDAAIGYGNGNGAASAGLATLVRGISGRGGPPAVAPQQAALLREASAVQTDLLSIIDSLQPLSTFADPGDVAALGAIIRAEAVGLLNEFSRATLLPRVQRVRVFLGGLVGWNPGGPLPTPLPPVPAAGSGDVGSLVTLLNLGGPLVPTYQVEEQLASQGVLISDANQLLAQWYGYAAIQTNPTDPTKLFPALWEKELDAPPAIPRPWQKSGLGLGLGPQPGVGNPLGLGPSSAQADWRLAVIQTNPPTPMASFTERMIRADILLPVIADDAGRVAGALDAIGLSSGEQETTFLVLNSLVDSDLLQPPGTTIKVPTTVTDVLDWAASLTDATSRDTLRQAGQLGLNLLADQADELFWLVMAMLDSTAAAQMQELGDAQVQQELLSFARDLNALANLAI